MRVNFCDMQVNLTGLQFNIDKLQKAVLAVDEAKNNGDAVRAHNKLMDAVCAIRKNLLPIHEEIEETAAKASKVLYKKLLKEKRRVA